MVKELYPYTTNNIYRQYFTEFYDFSDASKYKISTSSSGVSFNGLKPNIFFVPKNINKLKVDGLIVDSYGVTMTIPHSQNFTLCIVTNFWRDRLMNIISHVLNTNLETTLKYDKNTNRMTLTTNRGSLNIIIPSNFHGKKIVIWLTENSNSNITKVSISNYSSTLTQASSPITNQRQNLGFFSDYALADRFVQKYKMKNNATK